MKEERGVGTSSSSVRPNVVRVVPFGRQMNPEIG